MVSLVFPRGSLRLGLAEAQSRGPGEGLLPPTPASRDCCQEAEGTQAGRSPVMPKAGRGPM